MAPWDVVFGPKYNHHYLTRLKGRKKLVLGNHDRLRYIGHYFDEVFGVFYWRNTGVLSHIPLHECQVGEGKRFKYNLHGHLHGTNVRSLSLDTPRRNPCWDPVFVPLKTKNNPKYYNCCIDNIGFFPKPWEEIKQELENLGVL